MTNKTNEQNQTIQQIEEAVMSNTDNIVYQTEMGGAEELKSTEEPQNVKEPQNVGEPQETNEAQEEEKSFTINVDLTRAAAGIVGSLLSCAVTKTSASAATGLGATVAVSTTLNDELEDYSATKNALLGFSAGFGAGLIGGLITNALFAEEDEEEDM